MNKKKQIILFIICPLLCLLIVTLGVIGYISQNNLYINLNPDEKTAYKKAKEEIHRYAEWNKIDKDKWTDELILLLSRNREAEDFVLSYPDRKMYTSEPDMSKYLNTESVPLFMQWDKRWGYKKYGSSVAGITGCGPVCLSMAATYLFNSPEYSPNKIIDFAIQEGYSTDGSGSKWALISEGGKKLGLNVTELPLVERKISNALNAGHPVICVMGPGDFTTTGHFIVITDIRDGMYKINDPNSFENSQKLWDYRQIEGQIKNLWELSTD